MNMLGKILILVTLTLALSFGLVAIVNSSSTNSSISQSEPQQSFQPGQTGSTTQVSETRPPVREGDRDRKGGTGFALLEIGKKLGIIAVITLVVVLIQKGITKVSPGKQATFG